MLAVDKTDLLKHDKLIVCGVGNELDLEAVKSLWVQDYFINSLGHTASGWVVAMSQGGDYEDQKLKFAYTWPREWVENNITEGYYISGLGNDNGNWAVVCTKGLPYESQRILEAQWNNDSGSKFQNTVRALWDQHFAITSICYNPETGKWTLVFSKTREYGRQVHILEESWSAMEQQIRGFWKKGYSITDIGMAPGKILCIMSEKRGEDQYNSVDRAIINTSNFRTQLRDYWDQGYHVTRVCNGVTE